MPAPVFFPVTGIHRCDNFQRLELFARYFRAEMKILRKRKDV